MAVTAELDRLVLQLKTAETVEEKIAALDASPRVARFLKGSHPLRSILADVTPECEIALKQLIAIGQAPLEQKSVSAEDLSELLKHLLALDGFYRELGGIVGYQAQALRLLSGQKEHQDRATYHAPSFIDMSQSEGTIAEAIEEGLRSLPYL